MRPSFRVGRRAWPLTNTDSTRGLSPGNVMPRNCLPLLLTLRAMWVIICPSSATTLRNRAWLIQAGSTAASFSIFAFNVSE